MFQNEHGGRKTDKKKHGGKPVLEVYKGENRGETIKKQLLHLNENELCGPYFSVSTMFVLFFEKRTGLSRKCTFTIES